MMNSQSKAKQSEQRFSIANILGSQIEETRKQKQSALHGNLILVVFIRFFSYLSFTALYYLIS